MEQQKLSFDYRLALMSGVDVPIPELQLTMKQPTIKEISMLSEKIFFEGIQVLCIDKRMYIQEESLLNQTNNFQLFITMMNEKQATEYKTSVIAVMGLLFPQFKVVMTPRSIVLNSSEENVTIDEGNFEILQSILKEFFCLNGTEQQQYNPQSKKAREIAQKLMKARQKVAQLKAEENSGSIFSQYLSILTVGLHSMSLIDCLNLTMYQLYDLVERYMLYMNWDLDIKAKLAGPTENKPVDNWMKQIH